MSKLLAHKMSNKKKNIIVTAFAERLYILLTIMTLDFILSKIVLMSVIYFLFMQLIYASAIASA